MEGTNILVQIASTNKTSLTCTQNPSDECMSDMTGDLGSRHSASLQSNIANTTENLWKVSISINNLWNYKILATFGRCLR